MKPRFSIRDLLWLMLVVALGFGWWVNQVQSRTGAHRSEIRSLKQRVQELEADNAKLLRGLEQAHHRLQKSIN